MASLSESASLVRRPSGMRKVVEAMGKEEEREEGRKGKVGNSVSIVIIILYL